MFFRATCRYDYYWYSTSRIYSTKLLLFPWEIHKRFRYAIAADGTGTKNNFSLRWYTGQIFLFVIREIYRRMIGFTGALLRHGHNFNLYGSFLFFQLRKLHRYETFWQICISFPGFRDFRYAFSLDRPSNIWNILDRRVRTANKHLMISASKYFEDIRYCQLFSRSASNVVFLSKSGLLSMVLLG